MAETPKLLIVDFGPLLLYQLQDESRNRQDMIDAPQQEQDLELADMCAVGIDGRRRRLPQDGVVVRAISKSPGPWTKRGGSGICSSQRSRR